MARGWWGGGWWGGTPPYGSLTRLGYDTLRTDGTFGAGTRRAIIAWQEDEGQRATGYLTADQVRLIRVSTGG